MEGGIVSWNQNLVVPPPSPPTSAFLRHIVFFAARELVSQRERENAKFRFILKCYYCYSRFPRG